MRKMIQERGQDKKKKQQNSRSIHQQNRLTQDTKLQSQRQLSLHNVWVLFSITLVAITNKCAWVRMTPFFSD